VADKLPEHIPANPIMPAPPAQATLQFNRNPIKLHRILTNANNRPLRNHQDRPDIPHKDPSQGANARQHPSERHRARTDKNEVQFDSLGGEGGEVCQADGG